MGFAEVYDYVDGKLDWIAHGKPTEGRGPHYAVAGEIADRNAVLACCLGDRVGDVAEKLDRIPHDYCVVLNDRDVVLGRMRAKNTHGSPDQPVELVMEPGPSTVRPTEPAASLLERMRKRNVPTVIVTSKRGELLGAATQQALQGLIERSRDIP
jgi:CBS domain-containing protein